MLRHLPAGGVYVCVCARAHVCVCVHLTCSDTSLKADNGDHVRSEIQRLCHVYVPCSGLSAAAVARVTNLASCSNALCVACQVRFASAKLAKFIRAVPAHTCARLVLLQHKTSGVGFVVPRVTGYGFVCNRNLTPHLEAGHQCSRVCGNGGCRWMDLTAWGKLACCTLVASAFARVYRRIR